MTPEELAFHKFIENALEFILINRREKAFCNYTNEDIRNELKSCALNRAMIVNYVTNTTAIVGVVTASIDHKKKLVYVRNLLTSAPGVVPCFVKWMNEQYPNYKLEGRRYGNIKKFPVKRFSRHVNNLM